MPVYSDCNVDIYAELLRCQTISHLCCALELVGNLETQLNVDADTNAIDVSAGTADAAIDFFNFLVEKKNTLRTLDHDNGAQIVVPSEQDWVGVGAFTYGVYRYLGCNCKKIPFQMLDCPVKDTTGDGTPSDTPPGTPGPTSYTVFLTHLTNDDVSYETVAQIEDFLAALCCVKNHYKQIKFFLESQKY